MTKTEQLKTDLQPLVKNYLDTNKPKELEKFCKANSNLPGPRGNLELAYSLSDLMNDMPDSDKNKMFFLFEEWIQLDHNSAPVNDPAEFLVFCGVHSIGKIGSVSGSHKEKALLHLREMSKDKRWRTREAVCVGLQFMLGKYPEYVIENFNKWMVENNFLELRAIAAAYADPFLLKNKIISQNGLKTHRKIFDIVIKSKERKSDDFKTLRKALGFTFSLIATVYPPNSFGVMKKLLELNDKDITWIVKENLKKNRLVKYFPERVEEINNILKTLQK